MSEFNRQDCPPKSGPENEIVRVGKTGETYGFLLNESIEGYWTHWAYERTQACTKGSSSCVHCERGTAARWKGYVHVYCLIRKREIFVELTPGAAEMLLSQVSKGDSLRGLKVRVKRSGASMHGRVRVEVERYSTAPENLPPAKEVLPALKKLWRSE